MIDGRNTFAAMIAAGFILLTGLGYFVPIPPGNVKTLDGAMVALGTALGAAVMALLRTGKDDEKRTENTGKAFDALTAQANAGPQPVQPVVVTNTDAEPVPTTAQAEQQA